MSLSHNVLETLHLQISDLKKIREQVISEGKPATFEEYREQVGVLKGLNLALREIEILNKKLEED